jgi:hypothetical protein
LSEVSVLLAAAFRDRSQLTISSVKTGGWVEPINCLVAHDGFSQRPLPKNNLSQHQHAVGGLFWWFRTTDGSMSVTGNYHAFSFLSQISSSGVVYITET